MILKTKISTDTISRFKVTNLKTHYYQADLKPWTILKDSGTCNAQNVKDGFWKEYPIDTTALNSIKNIKIQSSKSEIYEPKIISLEGEYENVKKIGLWKEYTASIRSEHFFWSLSKINEYQNNVRNGREIWFEPFSKDTMMIFIYENGEPIKRIK